jgi:hypothetical protein
VVVPHSSDLNYESTSSNGCETLYSQVQAHNGGYKPAAKDVMGVLGKIEYITNARMQPDSDRGFYVPADTKATYGTTLLGKASSGAADDAASGPRQDAKARTDQSVSRIMGTFNSVPIRDLYRHRNPHLPR